MLIMPTSFTSERGILLMIINIFLLVGVLIKPNIFELSFEILSFSLFCITTSLFFIFIGSINSTPGYLGVMTVYFIWPILFTWMIGFISDLNYLNTFNKILILAIFINSLIFILFIVSSVTGLSTLNSLFFAAFDLRGGLSEAGFEFNILGMGLYIYGLSYLGTRLYAFHDTNISFNNDFSKQCYLIILIVCFGILLISGRRGFILATISSIPIAIFLCHVSGARRVNIDTLKTIFIKIPLLLSILIAIFSYILDYNLLNIISYFLSGFDFDNLYDSSANRRQIQFSAMINSWMENPFLGKGHGAFAFEAPGPDSQPWAYELQYIALLFQTGILGLFIYISAVFWLIFKAVNLSIKDRELSLLAIPACVGLLAFLVANATNPYLSKFDYLWTLFFLAALVNNGIIRANLVKLKSSKPTGYDN